VYEFVSVAVKRLRLPRIFFALLLPPALLLAACGDGGGTATPTGSPTGETPGATVGHEDSQTVTPSSTPSPTPTPTPSATSLEDLAAKFVQGPDGKVVYEYSSNFGGKPDGIYTVYRRDEDYRQDWHTTLAEIEFTDIGILVGTKAYSCTLTEIDSDCVEVTPELVQLKINPFQPIMEVPEQIAEGIADLEVEDLPSRMVAGVKAICFDVTVDGRLAPGPEGIEELELCFSADGQFLLMERRVVFDDASMPEGNLHLEAQSVGPATAADFEPPAPVIR
jgi:hypothetical protein